MTFEELENDVWCLRIGSSHKKSKEDEMKVRYINLLCVVGLALVFVLSGIIQVYDTVIAAQDARSTQLSARQIQGSCVGGDTVCDVENFEVLDNGHTIHFVSPDPISETLQGSWNQHCPSFSGLPSYIRVSVLNLQTMEMQNIDQTGSMPVCEAYFTLGNVA